MIDGSVPEVIVPRSSVETFSVGSCGKASGHGGSSQVSSHMTHRAAGRGLL